MPAIGVRELRSLGLLPTTTTRADSNVANARRNNQRAETTPIPSEELVESKIRVIPHPPNPANSPINTSGATRQGPLGSLRTTLISLRLRGYREPPPS